MPGYFINNAPDGDPADWHGGSAISERPTGIRGYYQSDVMVGDSAIILATFSKNGVNIGYYFYYITSQKSSYTAFDFVFDPPLSETPDSMIFGAVSSNAIAEISITGSILMINSITLLGVSTQPAWFNGSFENWDSLVSESPLQWYQDLKRENLSTKSTDAFKGSHSIRLVSMQDENEFGVMRTRPEQMATAFYPRDCNNCDAIGGYPFTNQNDTIVFWYKYNSQAGAQAVVRYIVRKNGATIGGTQITLGAASSFQKIEIPVESSTTPDTLQFFVQSSRWEDTLATQAGSTLIIDEIQLKSQALTTGIKNSWLGSKSTYIPIRHQHIFK